MASYVSNPLTFSPYISQMPLIQERSIVGREKQAQYEQGVQRIQSQIDNVAGLDVVKPIHKQYLQSKLDELGNNLKTVAAGDFSNFQLVSSVGGMVNQIAKDPRVINAVNSTNIYKQEQAKVNTAREKGELSPSNEFVFNKYVDKWFNSTDIDEPFKGRYIPKFDVDKYVRETFDALKPEGYTFDQLYQLDDKGNPIKQKVVDKKTGKAREEYILSTTMLKLKQEGLFPKRVQETLEQIFLNPQVNQQLQIDGEYNYRGYDAVNLSEKILIGKTAQLQNYEDVLRELRIKKNATTDKTELEQIEKEIDKYTQGKTRVDKEYDEMLSTVESNPDAIRGMLYKNDARDNYFAMYKRVTEERTLQSNPAWQAEFDMQKEANTQTRHADELRYKYKALEQDDTQFYAKLRADAESKTKPTDMFSYRLGPMPSDVDLIKIFDENYANAAALKISTTDKLLFESGVIQAPELANYKGTDLEKARREIVEKKAKEEGITVEEFRTKWYNEALSRLNRTPNSNNPFVEIAKISAENAQKLFSDMAAQKAKIDSKAPDPDLKKGLGTFYATTSFAPLFSEKADPRLKGMEVELSPDIQYDIALAYSGDGIFDNKTLKNKAKAAQERLEKKGIGKREVGFIVKGILNAEKLGTTSVPSQRQFAKLIQQIDKGENVQAWESRAAAIKEFYEFNPVINANFVTGDTETDKQNTAKLVDLISTYQSNNQNLSPNFNASDMISIAKDPEKGSVSFSTSKNEVTGDLQPKFIFYNNEGKVAGEMIVSTPEAQTFGYDIQNQFTDPEVKIAQTKIDITGNGTTSFGDVTDPYTYRVGDVLYTKSDLPRLSRMPQDVRANIKETTFTGRDGVQQSLFSAVLYVNDTETGKEYIKIFKTPKTSVDEVIQQLKQLNPQDINQLISEQKK